jgi:alkaline phosphatase D
VNFWRGFAATCGTQGDACKDGASLEAILLRLRRHAGLVGDHARGAGAVSRPNGLPMHRRLICGQLFRMHVMDTRSYRSDQSRAQARPTACRPEETPDSTMLRTALEALAGGGSQQRRTLESDRPAGLGRAPERPSGGQDRSASTGRGHHGYPAARGQLVKAFMDRELTNVVIATGDTNRLAHRRDVSL